VDRPGGQRHRQPDHADRAAVPGLRVDRVDARGRRATAVQLVPILIFALGAGSVADAVDRRKLLFITQLGLLACSAALLLLSLQPAPPLIALFAVAFVAAGVGAVDQPATVVVDPAPRARRSACRRRSP
jgi:MFS family permease